MDLWVQFPQRTRTVKSLSVMLKSLATQLDKLPSDRQYKQIKLDKDTRTIRVVILDDDENTEENG
ncbi:hypothetical protein AAC03nite_20470 [Alicyclobacillus acidoterrestris]|nr:hypothetical protein AAC03nite_20470 [Alicyclobacillus acidoterrestris]